jgi:uncharacterized protein
MTNLPCPDKNVLLSPACSNEFRWLHEPASSSLTNGKLTIAPKANSDFFRSPKGVTPLDNAPLWYVSVTGDFSFRAHLKTDLKAFGDAGGLTLRASAEQWAKLCIERSPAGEINVISVVTDGISDDANNELLSGQEAHLRITKRGDLIGMHYSLDGNSWRFARAFRFPGSGQRPLLAGVHAQSPYGEGCSAVFSELFFSEKTVQDFKSGE